MISNISLHQLYWKSSKTTLGSKRQLQRMFKRLKSSVEKAKMLYFQYLNDV